MDSLIFAIEAVLPIVLVVAIEYLIKRVGFAKMTNKLVFRVFLPAMLFLNVYEIERLADVLQFDYILYAVAATVIIFMASVPAVVLATKRGERLVLAEGGGSFLNF